MKPFRKAALSRLRSYDFLRAWAFEDRPANTTDVPSWCIRKAADSDFWPQMDPNWPAGCGFRKPVLYPLSYEGIVPICRDFTSAATRQEYQSCWRVAKSSGNAQEA